MQSARSDATKAILQTEEKSGQRSFPRGSTPYIFSFRTIRNKKPLPISDKDFITIRDDLKSLNYDLHHYNACVSGETVLIGAFVSLMTCVLIMGTVYMFSPSKKFKTIYTIESGVLVWSLYFCAVLCYLSNKKEKKDSLLRNLRILESKFESLESCKEILMEFHIQDDLGMLQVYFEEKIGRREELSYIFPPGGQEHSIDHYQGAPTSDRQQLLSIIGVKPDKNSVLCSPISEAPEGYSSSLSIPDEPHFAMANPIPDMDIHENNLGQFTVVRIS